MRLSQSAAYALHALAHLAGREGDAPLSSRDIARACHVPERFLQKVLKPLAAAGVLRSAMGANGGYRLAKPAGKITLLEVVELVDGPIRGEAPALGNPL